MVALSSRNATRRRDRVATLRLGQLQACTKGVPITLNGSQLGPATTH